MAKPKKVQITLSAELERKLILWAATRDEKLPGWIKTVLRLRVDENWDKVQKNLREKAERLEMSQEELERKILTQYGFDFNRELEELNEAKSDTDS